VAELEQKIAMHRLEIALCGHFSAGKSSLLNFICEKSLLPTSPIPTSANLVRIAYGEPHIEVEMGERHTRSSHPLDISLLDTWCRNGEDIRAIEIYDHIPYLQEGLGLLDTPGIDSTDPAHKRATEAALHLADVVFYVMDYNHVQSEWNFSFVKQLQDRKKPVVLIVNQIDKHRSEELTFEQFRTGTRDSFASWGIEPLAILYVSVKVPDHPYSEWDRLRALFQQLKVNTTKLVQNNCAMSIETIVREAIAAGHVDREVSIEALEAQLMTDEAKAAQTVIAEVETQRTVLLNNVQSKLEANKKEALATIDNANFTPSNVRDALETYVTSLQPNFKVGLFGAAKKTEEERAKREQAFTEILQSHILSNAVFHLQAWVEGIWASDHVPFKFESPLTSTWLQSQVGAVPTVSGEFVLNVSRKLSESIKLALRQQVNGCLTEWAKQLDAQLASEQSVLDAKVAPYHALVQAAAQLRELQAAREAEVSEWLTMVPFAYNPIQVEIPASHVHVELAVKQELEIEQGDFKAVPIGQAGGTQQSPLFTLLNDLTADATSLDWVAPFRAALIDRAERMANQSYVFALFGAFSAGKSSFANALLGESVLPVSPNPTTAAINRIVPVSEAHPHKTAWISMKSAETLLDDVKFALRMLGFEVADMAQALSQIAKLREADVVAKVKPHFSFLKAVERGLSDTEALRGQRWLADYDQFRDYAAKEWLSCFVEEIELAYACSLTDAGVRLVDTPGADSIHARHTGVAFKFIKEADALFFVTYYNHAFSQADQAFLGQLGQVKNQFELDKMFFIINAADLASDEAELNTVVDYVRGQLQLNGVQTPRLFPLSSMEGLKAKHRKQQQRYATSGMMQLEQELAQFVQADIHALAEKSALQVVADVCASAEEQIAFAKADGAKQVELRQALVQKIDALSPWLATELRNALVERMGREQTELLFHVERRMQYRFGDWFIAAFHPSLWSTGQKDHGRLLNQAWQEVMTNLSYVLSQEMLATTLRLEKGLQQHFTELRAKAHQLLAKQLVGAGFAPQWAEFPNIPTPAVHERVDSPGITPAWLSRYFKNPKDFFEGQGRQQLRLALEPQLEQFVHAYVEQHMSNWTDHYATLCGDLSVEVEHAVQRTLGELKEKLGKAPSGEAEIRSMEQWLHKVQSSLQHL
jgi:small GTP-binding protein